MINFIQKVVKKIRNIGRSGEKVLKEKAAFPAPPPELSRPDSENRAHSGRPPRKRGKRSGRAAGASAAPAAAAPDAPWRISQFKVSPAEGKTRFHDFDLPDPLMHAISDLGFQYCTPIQAEILPSALSGKDASGRAQTGTGKTAAFLIAVITRMLNNPIQGSRKPGTPRVLVIAPTRELVLQISEEARQLAKYTDIKVISLFGGMDYEKQRKQLAGVPVDIVVATPGRLLDFRQRRDLILNKTEVMIIDEADRMLDMGFIPDVRNIIHSTPPREKRQTMLFSATLTEDVTRLAAQWTHNPVTVNIEPEQVAVDTVDQIVYIATTDQKFALLYNIIDKLNLERVLVFCNRKDQVRRLAEILTRYGINCAELSGDIPQQQRIHRLDQFKAGKIRVLVATDVAGRGLHIEGMDHVINFTLPHDPEDYVHRIGRTGRAGAAGTSISFADEEEAFYLPPIEAYMGRKLSCIEPEEGWLILPKPAGPKKRRRPDGDRKTASAGQQRDSKSGARSGRRRPSPRSLPMESNTGSR
ncbi:MAG TPA: ATP-dependent RNA helicase RhlB [Syntrophales bacterium]|nr:ATP-dependent RNA helicase RhlB [Syntrophales bacterium]